MLPALLLTVSTIFMAAPANALPTDRDQPLQVSADSATFDEKTGVAVYKGSVVIRQGSLEMRADEFVIKVNKKGAVESTTSRGNPARFQQTPDAQKSPVLAEADRIDYDLKNEIVTLTGKARLRQDGASFQGATISYNTARQQVEAKGDASNRVQLVLPPQPREARPAPAKDTRK
ncbi:MAG: lipopolysaccharide transport periplasmic protein LptA [Moraxellaceae bacterium]|nr:lipopolysaccharide transport periplasmic protein LptA [Moraxellaceae bacterium]